MYNWDTWRCKSGISDLFSFFFFHVLIADSECVPRRRTHRLASCGNRGGWGMNKIELELQEYISSVMSMHGLVLVQQSVVC